MDQPFRDYNETDILYLLMTYVNFSSGQDMYYSIAKTILTHLEQILVFQLTILQNYVSHLLQQSQDFVKT